MHSEFIEEVKRKIGKRYHLEPMFTSTHCIPERLFEYNERVFLVYNLIDREFELHGLDQSDSFSNSIPFKELDVRTLNWVWKTDVRVHGREIFRRIERAEENDKAVKKRELKNWVEAVGKETQSAFAKDAWGMAT